jgi:hypothetical protein
MPCHSASSRHDALPFLGARSVPYRLLAVPFRLDEANTSPWPPRMWQTRRPLAPILAAVRGTEQTRPQGGALLRGRFHASDDH